MNMKKELFLNENKTDYSLKQGAIKSATDCGLKDKTVVECSRPKEDLELSDIDQYYGTSGYHNVMNTNVTDGIKYIMDNGYSWFVTDAIISIRMTPRLKKAEFLVVKLIVKPDNEAVTEISDGNDKVLYTQKYGYTNAKQDVTLYYITKVLLLTGEY